MDEREHGGCVDTGIGIGIGLGRPVVSGGVFRWDAFATEVPSVTYLAALEPLAYVLGYTFIRFIGVGILIVGIIVKVRAKTPPPPSSPFYPPAAPPSYYPPPYAPPPKPARARIGTVLIVIGGVITVITAIGGLAEVDEPSGLDRHADIAVGQ
jgi:hypothetical protein